MRERAATGCADREVLQVEAGRGRSTRDQLAQEVPVAVHVDGVAFAVMMLSPTDLDDFAYGFALTELGIAAADLVSVHAQERLEGIELDIRTRVPDAMPREPRRLPGRSGCGICGSRHLEDVVAVPAAVRPGTFLTAEALETALRALPAQTPLNAATGATHAAGWFDAAGALRLVREDVGRHNALDKLIGARLRAGAQDDAGFALVTSRASYEMVTKAARAGMGTLVAMSAPTALAVDLAKACGLTLVGFARPGRHVVYAGVDAALLRP